MYLPEDKIPEELKKQKLDAGDSSSDDYSEAEEKDDKEVAAVEVDNETGNTKDEELSGFDQDKLREYELAKLKLWFISL